MRIFHFFVENERYAVDAGLIEKVTRRLIVTPVPAAPPEVVGIANMKGNVVTVLSAGALLYEKQARTADGPKEVSAIIFKDLTGADQMGLEIDRFGDMNVIGDDAILPPPLPESRQPQSLPVTGVAEMNGTLYRIIDPDSIIRRFRENGIRRDLSEPQGGTDHE